MTGERRRWKTALHWAADRGDVLLVKLAISSGADIDKPNTRVDGRTALHSAATHNYPDVIRTWSRMVLRFPHDRLDQYPAPHSCMVQKRPCNKGTTSSRRRNYASDGLGNTPAHCSATRGHGVRSLSLFMSAGFDPRTRGENGQTILHTATE